MFQGSKKKCSKVPRFQDYTWFQGFTVAFFLTPLPAPRIETRNRILAGKFLRLQELHLQFPDVQTLWTIKTPPKCSIRRPYCSLWSKNVQACVAFTLDGTSRGRQRDDFLNAEFTLGGAQKERGGMTVSSYCNWFQYHSFNML